ncbi:DUF721 domain-containing protein [Elusimicrobiota bacterium]
MSEKTRWVKASQAVRSWSFRQGLESDRMAILHQVWERELGHLSRHWSLNGVKRGILYVKTASPAAAQELQLRGGQIVKNLNKHFKRSWIKAIKTVK